MGLMNLFSSKRTPFEELWKQVEGIPDGAKKQIPMDLSDRTKRKLEKLSPEEITEVINMAFEEVNKGSVIPMDILIRNHIGAYRKNAFSSSEMDNRRRKVVFWDVIVTLSIIAIFFIVNYRIDTSFKQRISFIPDGRNYCYGIDAFERDEKKLALKGWFFELKSVRNVPQNVSQDDAELMLALLPIQSDANIQSEDAVFMDVLSMKEDRPDVNNYFRCEYDYSKCGFEAEIDSDDLDLDNISYRLVIKPNALSPEGIITNIYIFKNGLYYTDPIQSPKLETKGTDLDEIIKNGMRIVSCPEGSCYVYQYKNKLYWIADEGFPFSEDGRTYIQYHIETTQFDKLPAERHESGWIWSDIGGMFEDYEVTGQLKCGKYRVMEREIPRDYSVSFITTGCVDGENWVWKSEFRPIYDGIINTKI